ncbi:MAG: alpha/beta hydrolase [Syntrophorhabdaceae bacterium]|nr:alpha/beta hydrolase [Syntrophorhabdaceae bacterium]
MKYIITAFLALLLAVAMPWTPSASAGQIDQTFRNPSAQDTVNWLPKEMPTRRITYTNNSLTYGDLRLPGKSNLKGKAKAYPVVVMIHGGAWTAGYSLDYVAPLAEALTDEGIATWNIEYRRIENTGGAYPNTFRDVAAAIDYLRVLAPEYGLDLDRVVVAGHSSGGHLALWAGSRASILPSSRLYVANPLPVRGVVSLAGIPNLKDALERGNRTDVLTLLGGVTAAAAISLYPETSPYHMLPTGVPTSHIVGTSDNPWRVAITEEYVEYAKSLGDWGRIAIPVGANHFDVVDPCGPAWPTIVTEVLLALGEKPPNGNLNQSKFCPVSGR